MEMTASRKARGHTHTTAKRAGGIVIMPSIEGL